MKYTDVQKKETEIGIKYWKNEKNKFNVIMLHYTADPEKDPLRYGKEWYTKEQEGVPRAQWNKEYEIDFATKSGELIYGPKYCDFDPKVHFIDSFSWDSNCQQLISLDFGQRHPTAALIGVWTSSNVLYIVDEYWKPAIPSVSSREMFDKFESYIGNLEGLTIRQKRVLVNNVFSIRVIDPKTTSKNRTTIKQGEEIVYSVKEEFYDNGWDFDLAINNVDSGITRVREYFQIDNRGNSHLYILKNKCPNLCRELENYRYQEYTEVQLKTRSVSEKPVEKNDDTCDALRYMIMTRPNNPIKQEKQLTRVQKDIQNLLKPRIISGWDDDSNN